MTTRTETFTIRKSKRARDRVTIKPFGTKRPPPVVTIETDCCIEMYPYTASKEEKIELPPPPKRWGDHKNITSLLNGGATIPSTNNSHRPFEDTPPPAPTIPHVVRISNLTGCNTPAEVISLIYRRFFRRMHFIYVTECMSNVFVGLYNENSAEEFQTLFHRYGHGNTLCECKILSAADRKKTA
jgi:hypothetical protein